MMRKVAEIALGIGLALALAGCQSEPGEPSEALAPETPAATAPDALSSDDPASAVAESLAPAAEPIESEPDSATAEPTPAETVSEPETAKEPEKPAPVAMTRPQAFAKCGVCHADKQGQGPGVGPNLFGIADTKAGEVAGFSFSPAMKASGVTWTRQNLDRFIEAPQSVVPGTRMPFGGIADAAERKVIVDYLMQLK